MKDNSIEQGKTNAIVSYITIIGAIIAIVQNNEPKNHYASFHIRQALGIELAFLALGYFIGYFDSWAVSMGFYIFFFILWAFGFISALQGQYGVIPVLGPFFQKLFKNL